MFHMEKQVYKNNFVPCGKYKTSEKVSRFSCGEKYKQIKFLLMTIFESVLGMNSDSIKLHLNLTHTRCPLLAPKFQNSIIGLTIDRII